MLTAYLMLIWPKSCVKKAISDAKQNQATAVPIANWHALPELRCPSRRAKAMQFGQALGQWGGGQATPYPRLGNHPWLREAPQKPTGIPGCMLKLTSYHRLHGITLLATPA